MKKIFLSVFLVCFLFLATGPVFASDPPEPEARVPRPQALAVNHERAICAEYFPGDEWFINTPISGWESYYDEGAVPTFEFQEMCESLGYEFTDEDVPVEISQTELARERLGYEEDDDQFFAQNESTEGVGRSTTSTYLMLVFGVLLIGLGIWSLLRSRKTT